MTDAGVTGRPVGPLAAIMAMIARQVAIDLRSLAAFRVLVAITTLSILFVVFPDAEAFYSDSGITPRQDLFARISPAYVSLFNLSGDVAFVQILLWGNVLAALALLVGWRSRLSAAICWALFVSLAHRNDLVPNGGDLLLGLLLFWAIFLPTGAVFSVDSALSPTRPTSMAHLSAATVGLLLQASYVYVFGALLKTAPEWIPNGSAVYMAMHLDSLTTPLAYELRKYPEVMFLLTYAIWSIELIAPALLFFPDRTFACRRATIVLLAFMHVSFRLFLDIGMFWLASLASLAPFLPVNVWDWVERHYWKAEQRRITLYYDAGCGFCRKVCLLLRVFFLPSGVAIVPAQSIPEIGAVLEREDSWVVVDWTGRQRLGWQALTFVCTQSRMLAPIGWLCRAYGAVGLGEPTYRLIGKSRHLLGRVTALMLAERPLVLATPRWVQAGLAGVAVLAFAWNVQETARPEGGPDWFPAPVVASMRAIGQTQRWTMFAPYPGTRYAWPVMEGRTNDGRVVDVWHTRWQAPSREQPAYIAAEYQSSRWRAYFDRVAMLEGAKRDQALAYYAAYRCRTWQRAVNDDPARSLKSISITLMVKQTLSNYESTTRVVEAGTWVCQAVTAA